MSADPRATDAIERLLQSVCDESAVDWDGALASSGGDERRRVESLREVARIAAFHKDLVRDPKPARPLAGGAEPARWGSLILLEHLGTGARGDVWRAWDPALRREVALKLLRDDAASLDDSPLLREGRAAARVRHPNVVTVHGLEVRDGRVGLWMQLASGTSLERHVRVHGPLAPADAARLGADLAGALAAVHEAGLVHRDVKPANVVRDAEGRWVLADFGLGTTLEDAAGPSLRPSGTPLYMAPELLAGGAADERTDLYALGMLVRFALVGRHAFENAEDLAELKVRAAQGVAPVRDERPEIPAALAAVVDRATLPQRADRFARAADLADALRAAAASGTGPRPRAVAPPSVWVRTAAVIAAFALLAVLAARGPWRPFAPPPPAAPALAAYGVEAALVLRTDGGSVRLANGDRVEPGDRLSLELHATRAVYAYVINEDERGEAYLLFPQPAFDLRNPLPPDSSLVLPGTMGGRENAWTVTSAGGREHFLIVVSPEPVAELESDLAALPAPSPDRPVQYAALGEASQARLRGAGGLSEVPSASAERVIERYRALGGREDDVTGVWVRHVVLENPAR